MTPGTILRYWRKRGGWATLIYQRTITRGKKKGYYECLTSDEKPRKKIVKPDEIRIWGE
jgi:hypothetical protein